MKPIIVIELPFGMGIDREITEPLAMIYSTETRISKLSGRS